MRGRLEIVARSDSSVEILSQFEFPLTDLYYQDQDKTFWHAVGPVRQGEKIELKPIEAFMAKQRLAKAADSFAVELDTKIENLFTPGACFALFTSDEAFYPSLPSIQWNNQPSILMTRPLLSL